MQMQMLMQMLTEFNLINSANPRRSAEESEKVKRHLVQLIFHSVSFSTEL